MACDFSASWPSIPHYSGNFLQFIVMAIQWSILALGSLVWDTLGAFGVGFSCLVYYILLSPSLFLYQIFQNSVASFAQYGPLAPLYATLVFSASVLILLALVFFSFREVSGQFPGDVQEIEGKSPPRSGSIAGEAESEA